MKMINKEEERDRKSFELKYARNAEIIRDLKNRIRQIERS